MLARVMTAVAGIPIIIYCASVESIWPLKILLCAIWALMYIEFNRVEKVAARPAAWVVPVVTLAAALAYKGTSHLPWGLALAGVGVIAAASLLLSSVRLIALQTLWLGIPIFLLINLRIDELRDHSDLASFSWTSKVLLLFVLLWVGDTFAFLVGRSIGKNKIAPSISPGKSWEGASANLVFTCAFAWLLAQHFQLSIGKSLVLGIGVSVFGQLGDLFQSRWKRSRGIKDSGGLLPGHGGLLDRFDSLLFAVYPAMLVFYCM